MPFWKHTYHIVWATKNRQPWILPEYEARLYAFLASKAGEVDAYLHAINGTTDHVHLVTSIPPKHSVAWVVKTLKGSSAYFVNTTLQPRAFHFVWQRGYGSLTIGERQRETAIAYVNLQKQHHLYATTIAWLERLTDDQNEDEEDAAIEQSEKPVTSTQGGHALKEPSFSYTPVYDTESPF